MPKTPPTSPTASRLPGGERWQGEPQLHRGDRRQGPAPVMEPSQGSGRQESDACGRFTWTRSRKPARRTPACSQNWTRRRRRPSASPISPWAFRPAIAETGRGRARQPRGAPGRAGTGRSAAGQHGGGERPDRVKRLRGLEERIKEPGELHQETEDGRRRWSVKVSTDAARRGWPARSRKVSLTMSNPSRHIPAPLNHRHRRDAAQPGSGSDRPVQAAVSPAPKGEYGP